MTLDKKKTTNIPKSYAWEIYVYNLSNATDCPRKTAVLWGLTQHSLLTSFY